MRFESWIKSTIRSCLFFCVMLQSVVSAHPAHETHAEMQWNADSKTLEVALKIRGIDLEAALSRRAPDQKRIDLAKSAEVDKRIAEYLAERFVFTSQSNATGKLRFIGKEVDENTAWLYFECHCPGVTTVTGTSITNRILFDTLEGQINKAELKVGDASLFLSFSSVSCFWCSRH